MSWLNIDFVQCDETESSSLVVELEPHWCKSSFQEAYDAKLPPHYSHPNEIIFHKEGIDFNSPISYSRKQCFVKTLYLDLETLFSADNIVFDLPSNEDIIIHYQSDVILVSPIKHKEFRVDFAPWFTTALFQSYIIAIWYLYHTNDSILNYILADLYDPSSREVEEVVKLQTDVLSNFSEEEMKAMYLETSPLYIPIVMECMRSQFDTFIWLINSTNNKEFLTRMLSDERIECRLSGEAKVIIIKRMSELEDKRSFEL